MNNNKNKLNSEIIFIFHPNPNAQKKKRQMDVWFLKDNLSTIKVLNYGFFFSFFA